MSLNTDTEQNTDATIIRQSMQEWCDALSKRDLARLTAGYDKDVILYDIGPTAQLTGAEAYRKNWENCFSFLPENIRFEIAELKISASGDVAFAHCFNRMVNATTNEDATCGWVRVTVCFQRQAGEWKTVHEHVSLPIDPVSGKMLPITAPLTWQRPTSIECQLFFKCFRPSFT